ncbi:MAG: F0F1 ATP synthase subunit alpha [Alphaproteobacteria bacterium]|nr:F0F1 ATP synthase subunit alpha [Alphaproteobacteria bacterium]
MDERTLDLRPVHRGYVSRIADGVAGVVGLEGVASEELVQFESGALGVALELSEAGAGVAVLTDPDSVRARDAVRPLGRTPDVPTGDALFGRVVDPLGRPLDGLPPPLGERRSVFGRPPEILERVPVERPLLTGITALDGAVPIGLGQRQLVVGDHNTGRTSLALDIVAAQRDRGVACVLVHVGGPVSRTFADRDSLAAVGALRNTVIVAGPAHTTAGLQFLAPMAGMAVAEALRDAGRDVLVVFDDLTKHADTWRQLALLLGRPPGREAFPGDIFYLHAELLERAAPLKSGGSITALPLVETTDGELSAYIPTNLISITDGQVVLDATRFDRNERPAIDIGRSVSRIGGAAQLPVVRAVSRDLRIMLAQADSLEALTRVGLDVDAETARTLHRGRVLRQLLRQDRLSPRGVVEHVLALSAVSGGALDDVEPADAPHRVFPAVAAWRRHRPEDAAALTAGEEPAEGWKGRWLEELAVKRR